MIARVWRGWAKPEDADTYEKLLREVVYPSLHSIAGYQGDYILRHDQEDECEENPDIQRTDTTVSRLPARVGAVLLCADVDVFRKRARVFLNRLRSLYWKNRST